MNKIEQLKKNAQENLNQHDKNIQEGLANYYNPVSDYMIHQRVMSNYYRGYINALIDLNRGEG